MAAHRVGKSSVRVGDGEPDAGEPALEELCAFRPS
jgi:hypothetical protein